MADSLNIDFEQMVQSAPDGIVVADDQGRIVLVNEQASRLFGYEARDLLGQKVELLIPEELRDGHVEHRGQFARRPTTRPMGLSLDLFARHQDGSRFPVEISLSPTDTDGTRLVTAVIRDVTERRRLEAERERLHAELQTERERQRIGMDLHDGVMQAVYAVSLTLELAAGDIENEPAEAKVNMDRAIDQLHGVVRDIRSYIFDLRPRDYTGDLKTALTNLATEFRQNSLIDTFVDVASEIGPVSPDAGVALYHVTHEALSNIRKHAHATSVVIRLEQRGADLILQVTDNGAGFDISAERAQTHRGLRNIIARLQGVGGNVDIKSHPGSGTTVIAHVPGASSARYSANA